jgi:hypothetical protein
MAPVTDPGGIAMKPSLLISITAALLVGAIVAAAPLAAPSSPAQRAAIQTLPGFRSPSGNIKCFVAKAPYCSINRAGYTKQLQDRCIARTGLDWHGFKLAGTRARVYCTSNPPYDMGKQRPSNAKLAYGKTFRHAGFTCTSRVTGVTCRNGAGHALFISRQAWRAS